jgi:UDP-glucose 4-epimerase
MGPIAVCTTSPATPLRDEVPGALRDVGRLDGWSVVTRALMFGATGYLGANLHAYLADQAWEVIVPKRTDGSKLDLGEREALNGIDWDVDCVFVFAGVTGTASSFDDYRNGLRGNNLALLNILDAIRFSSRRPRVVFPSTRLVYDGHEAPIAEDGEKFPRTLYAANKAACEAYLSAYGNGFGIPYTVCRIGVPYGSVHGTGYSFGTIGNFIKQLTAHGRIRIFGDGSPRRTFTHVDDLCRMIVEMSTHERCADVVFNVPGTDLSIVQAASILVERIGFGEVEHVAWPEFDRKIESGSTVFDASHLMEILQDRPRTDFETWCASLKGDPEIRMPRILDTGAFR